MRFTLAINMMNDAFMPFPQQELARILGEVRVRVSQATLDRASGDVRDINGNTVGEWKITKRRER